MSTTITFKTGEKFTVNSVWGKSATFQGADRKVLEIRIENTGELFEQLKAIYTNHESLAEIYVEEKNNEGEITGSSYHNDYTLNMELGLKTIDSVQYLVMKIAQKTALEIMQEKQAIEIENLKKSLKELSK